MILGERDKTAAHNALFLFSNTIRVIGGTMAARYCVRYCANDLSYRRLGPPRQTACFTAASLLMKHTN